MSHLPADIHRRLVWRPPANNSFLLKNEGRPFRCSCGANVFHKDWDNDEGEIYVCNGCEAAYKGE